MEAKLLTQLVDETFENQSQSTDIIDGSYHSSIHCYRFNINGENWDFPETWSFFSKIGTNVLPLEKWVLAEFDNDNDPLHLIKCFKGSYKKIVFFVKSERLYLELKPNQESDNTLLT